MDFQYGEKGEKLRKDLREFVKECLPPGHRSRMAEEEHFDDAWELYMATAKKTPGAVKHFKTKQEAMEAYQRGEINVNTPVEIAELA